MDLLLVPILTAEAPSSLLDKWPLDLNFTLLAGAVGFCALFLFIMVIKGPGTDEPQSFGMPLGKPAGGRPAEAMGAPMPALRARDAPLVDTNALPSIVWATVGDPQVRRFNQTWTDFTGRSREGSGSRWTEYVHPDDVEDVIASIARKIEMGLPMCIEYRLKRADGEYRWMLEMGTPHRDGIASAQGMVGITIDMTERREQAEEWQEQVQALTERNMQLQQSVAEMTERKSEMENEIRQLRLEAAASRGATADRLAVSDVVPIKVRSSTGGGGDDKDEGFKKRVHARLPIEGLTCNLGEIDNLSLGGMGIKCKTQHEGIVDVTIETKEGAPIDVKAEVVWSKKDGRRFEHGLRFLNLSDAAAQRLTSLATVHRYRRVMDDALDI